MSPGRPLDGALRQRLGAVLSRLEAAPGAAPGPKSGPASGAGPAAPPLRSVHHMACSGGSLISRALVAMPSVTLLSEIDPLSPLGLAAPGQVPQFRPSDLIYAARCGARPLPLAAVERVFLAALAEMRDAVAAAGGRLCLRDHAHSQFCVADAPESRPSLRELLSRLGPVRSVVTVRHPVDSYLSLQANSWIHFTPDTIEEYARRYLAFLAAHAGVEILRYEDFVADPEAALQRLCTVLDLPYVAGAADLASVIRVTGESGRSSDRIAPRPRRPVPDALRRQIAESEALVALCARLGYGGPEAAGTGGEGG